MKKVIVLILSLLLMTGCSNVNKEEYNQIITSVVTSRYDIKNTNRTGYKYYIPNGMSNIKSVDYNEVLADSNYNYYLYVDVVSYFNRVIKEYNINDNAYYSNNITFEDKYGYLEINKQENDKYLIEIMYNYAKIEVIVDKIDLNEAVTNSIILLSSISYNNNVLESVIGDNALEFSDETYNIFETKEQQTNYLKFDEDIYEGYEEPEVEDPDLVG